MSKQIRTAVIFAAVILTTVVSVSAQTVKESDVRTHMEFLASDEMQGRGSGTKFEKLAGLYLASQLKLAGIAPGGDKDAKELDAYIQTVEVQNQTLGKIRMLSGTTGLSINGLFVRSVDVKGKLQKLEEGGKPNAGAVVLYRYKGTSLPRQALGALLNSPASAVVVVIPKGAEGQFANPRPQRVRTIKGVESTSRTSLYWISEELAEAYNTIADGDEVEITAEVTETKLSKTWNSVGVIHGSTDEAILLSAHMDHVGVRGDASKGDNIYNGADDDASGCVAVLEIAKEIAKGKKPKRTIYIAFFGSEEAGGFGSRYFVGTFPRPLDKLIANLQFEMIGRPDLKVGKDELWLTGFERSDLGPELAKNGAKLVQDPHPQMNFFFRSDNITLARKGVVAHTVSSYNLHKDYHQPSDENKTIDFSHMTKSIQSMIKPIDWLANTDWKPSWKEGMRP